MSTKAIDGAAVATVALNWFDMISGPLVGLTTLLTFVWAAFRVYEMETVQRLLPNRWRLPRFRDVG